MQKSILQTTKKEYSLAHSPDADDAFMFYALSQNIIQSNTIEIKHELKDIQTLNEESQAFKYDVQAISFFTYPEIEDKYQLLSCGSSFGIGYGPVLVSSKKLPELDLGKLKGQEIAVPGVKTTAFLLLKLLLKDFKPVVVPFDKILDYVSSGKCSLGLLIHEGQLSYTKHGLSELVDLGQWWLGKTNLPVPLGGNVIKRSLPDEVKSEINSMIKESISYALSNKEKIIPAVSEYARELEGKHNLIDRFVSMYVNEYTLDYGIQGKLALQKLYQLAFEVGLIQRIPKLDFVK